jgi:hypothetical protein
MVSRADLALSAAFKAALSFAMISGGVLAGATMPIQPTDS